MKFVSRQLAETVVYGGDNTKYDLELFSLGKGADEFYVPNPIWPDVYRKLVDKSIKSKACILWVYEKDWLFKKFHKDWRPELGYEVIELSVDDMPKISWRRNPDIPDHVEFYNDPLYATVFEIPRWEITYKHIWYLDHRFTDSQDKIWLYECKTNWYDGETKDHGYVTPDLSIEYNPEIPTVEYDIPSTPLYDLDYEHIWYLDPKHGGWEGLWAYKLKPNYIDPKGEKHRGFISPKPLLEINEDYPLDFVVPYIDLFDLGYEHIWFYDTALTAGRKTWAVTLKFNEVTAGVKDHGTVGPAEFEQTLSFNPILSGFNSFDFDFSGFKITLWDRCYEHVWYIDNQGEKIWVCKATTDHYDPSLGIKDMGLVAYQLEQHYERNPIIADDLEFDNDPRSYTIPIWDRDKEHVWFVEHEDKKVWAYRSVTEFHRANTGIKDMGLLEFDLKQTYKKNPTIGDAIEFSVDPTAYVIPIWDRAYEHVWYVEHLGEKVWAYTCTTAYHDPTSKIKDMGVLDYWIDAETEYNPEIPDLKANINYKIPYSDADYEHIWFVDPKFTGGRKIWLARMWATDTPKGVKDMGYLIPDVAENLDVIFISYNEANAEENWQRVLDKAPHAKRVDGVKGIFEAHKKAAELAVSDMFYVVDGDAYLTDEWHFDFNPNIFDRDCVHVYKARNPINDLIYGYGGVKLFPRKLLLEADTWGIDMTTSVASKLKVVNKISNVTAFNTDPASTWRSAFRECAKLAAGTIDNQNIIETDRRLKVWLTRGKDRPFGDYALAGAAAGYEYGDSNKLNTELMKNINDRTWLDAQFTKCKISKKK